MCTKIILLMLLVLAIPTATMAGPWADYGDAPDPTFPSTYESSGPYHLDTAQDWLGWSDTSTTTREYNAQLTDIDTDDGGGWWVQNDGKTYFVTRVSYDTALSSASQVRYLNVVADKNGNGSWDNGAEWPVRNLSFSFDVVPTGINRMWLITRVDDFDAMSMLNRYSRVTLSTEQVSDGSGAWGQFARGETEDWTSQFITSNIVGTPGMPTAKFSTSSVAQTTVVGQCPQCPVVAPVVPHHPPHDNTFATTRTYTYTTPGTVYRATAKYVSEPNIWEGVDMCPYSFVTGSAGTTVLVNEGLVNVTRDFLAVPGGTACSATFTNSVALIGNPGHCGERLNVGYSYDPDGEWVYVTDWIGLGGDNLTPVPEPGSLMVLGSGLLGLAGMAVRRRR